jgi:hypothetical protein
MWTSTAVVVRLAAAGSIVPCPHPSLRWRFDLLVRQMLSMLLMILLQFEFFSIALDVHCAFCYRSRWWWSLIKKFLVSPNRIPTSANL